MLCGIVMFDNCKPNVIFFCKTSSASVRTELATRTHQIRRLYSLKPTRRPGGVRGAAAPKQVFENCPKDGIHNDHTYDSKCAICEAKWF